MYHLSCQGWINKLKLFSNKTLYNFRIYNVESSVSVYNAVITNLREGLTHMEAYINEGVRVWIGVFELKNEMISFTQNETAFKNCILKNRIYIMWYIIFIKFILFFLFVCPFRYREVNWNTYSRVIALWYFFIFAWLSCHMYSA